MADQQRNHRFIAAWLLVAGLSLYAVLALAFDNIRINSGLPPKAPVTMHEERILQLKPLLPKSGEVGYVTTVENERIFSDADAMRNVEYLAQYALTQYTLAPLIVRNRPDLPLVVGNFVSGPPPEGIAEKYGLILRRDFGEGLILYEGDRR